MRLSTRLLIPLVAAVSFIMLIYGWRTIQQRERALGVEVYRETAAYSAALGIALEYAFSDGELDDVRDILGRTARQPRIYEVLVYRADGQPLFSDAPPLAKAYARYPRRLRAVLEGGRTVAARRRLAGKPVYAVLRPIRGAGGQVVGAVEVVQPLAFIKAERQRARERLATTTVALLVVLTGLILWLVRRSIARPLREFVETVRAVGGGDLRRRIEPGVARGELRQLAGEFNRMADRLESARAELLREAEERIALERRLRETEKLAAIGNLAAGLAHEIAAPLNVVAGRAELLLRGEPAPEARERNLRIIVNQIRRITVIVRNLLDFARRREPRLQPMDVGAVVASVLEFLEGEFERAGIALGREGPASAWVRGDPHLLHQVLLNLLMNALQALEGGSGERRVVARVVGAEGDEASRAERIAVEVEDTGPGIPPDIRQRIFEPFFTTKPGGQGTGLGLAVVRGIVEEHGGEVEVLDREGGGTIFRLTLPGAPVPEAAHG